MKDRIPAEVEVAWDSFHQVVNMPSEELREWLLTQASGETALPADPDLGLPELGRKVVGLLRKRKVDLTAADADVMQQVVDYVVDRQAHRPPTGAADDHWRRSLMSVGHDPLRLLAVRGNLEHQRDQERNHRYDREPESEGQAQPELNAPQMATTPAPDIQRSI